MRQSAYLDGVAAVLPPEESLAGRVLQSELDKVPDEAWTRFCLAMKVQPSTGVSEHGGLGMFDLRVPRLADLDLVTRPRRVRLLDNRSSWEADWAPPLSERVFLTSPAIQYKTFVTSMKLYREQIRTGEIRVPRTKERLTMAAWLAILHKAGPKGLARWGEGKRFPNTEALVARVNGIF